MDIISINVATNRTIAKLKNEGIEALTLIGTDGKQYELTVDTKGELAVTVKGGNNVEVITFGDKNQYTTNHQFVMWYAWKISDKVVTQEQLLGCTIKLYFDDGSEWLAEDTFYDGAGNILGIRKNGISTQCIAVRENDPDCEDGIYVFYDDIAWAQQYEVGHDVTLISGTITFPAV